MAALMLSLECQAQCLLQLAQRHEALASVSMHSIRPVATLPTSDVNCVLRIQTQWEGLGELGLMVPSSSCTVVLAVALALALAAIGEMASASSSTTSSSTASSSTAAARSGSNVA